MSDGYPCHVCGYFSCLCKTITLDIDKRHLEYKVGEKKAQLKEAQKDLAEFKKKYVGKNGYKKKYIDSDMEKVRKFRQRKNK